MLQPSEPVQAVLNSNQYDLEVAGRTLLLNEARSNSYFLLGELHGENEIPALIDALWPAMWKAGYRHIGAEISPWAAYQLEFAPVGHGPRITGLWTRRQAMNAHAVASPGTSVLWGCDMEEMQPESLIRELAALNSSNPVLQEMVQLTGKGYSRKLSPTLIELATKAGPMKDKIIGGISLRQNLLATLEIDKNRASPQTKMIAQNERELLMKQQFLAHLQHESQPGSKVLLRFGRNHLHRGFDARGISTLGNFVAEYATAHGQQAFNVGAFAAGGKETLMGETWDADERQDEPTFALLAENAKYPATLFDLRPLRPLLHGIPQEKRTPLEVNLIYWADSYDALDLLQDRHPVGPGIDDLSCHRCLRPVRYNTNKRLPYRGGAKTRDYFGRSHSSEVDATIRERQPMKNLTRTHCPWFCL